jgi:hypothetical protein
MTIDYEPGGSTMIRINLGTKKKLEGMKKDKREGIDDVITRLIQENRKMKRLDKEPMLTQYSGGSQQPCLMPSTEKPI